MRRAILALVAIAMTALIAAVALSGPDPEPAPAVVRDAAPEAKSFVDALEPVRDSAVVETPAGETPAPGADSPLYIAGQVVGADGAPVFGALVAAYSDRNIEKHRHDILGLDTPNVTDVTGEFTLPMDAPGTYELAVFASIHEIGDIRELAQTQTVTLAADQPLTGLHIKLDSIHGFIVAGRTLTHDGLPAPNVSVNAQAGGRQLMPIASDAEGRFVFTGISASALVKLSAMDSRLGRVERDGVKPQDTNVELRMPEPRSVSGVVIDPAGRPVPRFELSIIREPHNEPGDFVAFEDPEGRFTIPGIATNTLIARADGFSPGWAQFDSPPGVAVEGVVIQLTPEVRATGHVRTSAGEPWPGARVHFEDSSESASDRYAMTDANGRYVLGELPELHYAYLVAEVPGAPRARSHAKQTAGQTEIVVDFVIDPGATIRGTVRYDESLGAPKATISKSSVRESRIVNTGMISRATDFFADGGGASQITVPVENGGFVFDRLPAGTYFVRAVYENHELDIESEHRVTVAAGETRDILLDLTRPGSAVVAGTVRHEGMAVPQASLILVCDAESGRRDIEAIADESGAFVIENVPAGEAVLYVRFRQGDGGRVEAAYPLAAAEGRRTVVDADTSQTGRVTLSLAEGVECDRVCAYFDGAPRTPYVTDNLSIGLAATARRGEDGRFVFPRLAPGRYTFVGQSDFRANPPVTPAITLDVTIGADIEAAF